MKMIPKKKASQPKNREQDPLLNPSTHGGSVAKTLAAARASLKNPTRPETPQALKNHRSLFSGEEYQNRPATAQITISSHTLLEKLENGEKKRNVMIIDHDKKIENDSDGDRMRPPLLPSKKGLTESQSDLGVSAETLETKQWNLIKRECKNLNRKLSSETHLLATSQILGLILNPKYGQNTFQKTKYGKRKLLVLKTLFKLMDSKNSELLMKISRITFLIVRQKSVVATVCKLLYKLSKDNKNDALFRTECLIDHLIDLLAETHNFLNKHHLMDEGTKPPASFETLLYIIGSLKNVSLSVSNQKILATSRLVEILTGFLKLDLLETLSVCLPNIDESKSCQLLVQVVSVIRNLCARPTTIRQILKDDSLDDFVVLMGQFPAHRELMFNISRLFSKLTLVPKCTDILASNSSVVKFMLQMLYANIHTSNPLVLRVCFILGNMTCNHENVRQQIAFQENGILPLINLLCKFSHTDQKDSWNNLQKSLNEEEEEEDYEHEHEGEEEGTLDESFGLPSETSRGSKKKIKKLGNEAREIEQILVKLIRLLANCAINEDVGIRICATPGIEVLEDLLQAKDVHVSEELVLNIIGAITNLSYYFDAEKNIILEHQLKIIEYLVPLLLHDNDEAVIQALRAFGNFSRSSDSREFMLEKSVDRILAVLLDHSDKQVVFNACGVLMNLVSGTDCQDLVSEDLVDKLIEILPVSWTTDLELSLVVCRVLYNICTDSGTSFFTNQSRETLYLLLSDILEALEDTDPTPDIAICNQLIEVGIPLLNLIEEDIEEKAGDLQLEDY